MASIWSMSFSRPGFSLSGTASSRKRILVRGGAQIVGDRADHGGAVLDIAFQPGLHQVEGGVGEAAQGGASLRENS